MEPDPGIYRLPFPAVDFKLFHRYQANNFDKPLLPRLYSLALEAGSPSTSLTLAFIRRNVTQAYKA
jgi:hypothetical protein